MAIETFNFSDNGVEHFSDIKTWLEANATDYFDSFELSEDKLTLTCKIGDKTALTFSRTSTGATYVESFYLYNGTTQTLGGASGVAYIDKIVKTTSGIALRKNYGGNRYNNYSFITKDNKGNTAFLFPTKINSNAWNVLTAANTTCQICYSVFSSEKTTFDQLCESFISPKYGAGIKADITALSPICFYNSNGSYTPNLMITVFGNVINTECTLYNNDDKYFYNGYVALKE